MPPLVVEGLTDAVFFSQLVKFFVPDADVRPIDRQGKERIPAAVTGSLRHDAPAIELEFRNHVQAKDEGTGKPAIPDVVTSLIRSGVRHVLAAADLNGDAPEDTVNSLKSALRNLLGSEPQDITQRKFSIRNETLTEAGLPPGASVVVGVIPMGLYEDSDLGRLGITEHEMEDYLIKVFLLDRSLRPEVAELAALTATLADTILNHNLAFAKSKELFQLMKPLVQLGLQDTTVVRRIFGRANHDVLRAVMGPLFSELQECAFP